MGVEIGMEDGQYPCLQSLCESDEAVEGKASVDAIQGRKLKEIMRSLKWACYDSKNYIVLADRVERSWSTVLRYGNESEIAEFEEICRHLTDGRRYEEENGPWSLLNWDHDCNVWVEKILVSEGRPTMRQQLESWRAARR